MSIIKLATIKEINIHSYPGFVYVEYIGYDLRDLLIRRKSFSRIFGKEPKIEDLEIAWKKGNSGKNRGCWLSPEELEWYKTHVYGDHNEKEERDSPSSDAIKAFEAGDFSGVVFGREHDGLVYDLAGDPVNRPIAIDFASFAFKNLEKLAEKLKLCPEVSEAEYYPAHCSECGSGVRTIINFTQGQLKSLIKDNGWVEHEPYSEEIMKLFPCARDHYYTDY